MYDEFVRWLESWLSKLGRLFGQRFCKESPSAGQALKIFATFTARQPTSAFRLSRSKFGGMAPKANVSTLLPLPCDSW